MPSTNRNPLACTRCRKLKVKCITKSYQSSCDKCSREGRECMFMPVSMQALWESSTKKAPTGESRSRATPVGSTAIVHTAAVGTTPRAYDASYGSGLACTLCRKNHQPCDGRIPCGQCLTASRSDCSNMANIAEQSFSRYNRLSERSYINAVFTGNYTAKNDTLSLQESTFAYPPNAVSSPAENWDGVYDVSVSHHDPNLPYQPPTTPLNSHPVFRPETSHWEDSPLGPLVQLGDVQIPYGYN